MQTQTAAGLSQLDRVSILAEALPYMQRFAGKTIVVKYGGAAMKDPTLKVCMRNARSSVLQPAITTQYEQRAGCGPARRALGEWQLLRECG